MSTFAALRISAAGRFRDVPNNVVSDAQWKDYVNQAYEWANTQSPLWPWCEPAAVTVTVTAGSNVVALPTDVLQVNSAYDTTDNYVLQAMEGRGEQDRHYLRTDTGPPLQYRVRGSSLEVFPTPVANTAVQLECVLMPVDMVADGDLPVWPSHFHARLLEGALARAYMDDGNYTAAAKFEALYEASIAKMLSTVLMFRDGIATPIRDTFFS